MINPQPFKHLSAQLDNEFDQLGNLPFTGSADPVILHRIAFDSAGIKVCSICLPLRPEYQRNARMVR